MSAESTGSVHAVWRYPVKSMLGRSLPEVTVVDDGIFGDREWGVVDLESGLTASAKHPARYGQLLRCRARLDGVDRPPLVSLPDGETYAAGTPDVDRALTALLGRRVALRRAERAPDAISRTDPTGARTTGPVELAPAITGSLGGAVPGSDRLVDFAPLHLVTLASLAALAARLPPGGADVRRFRPNVVLDVDVPPFAEDGWVDRQVLVGSAVLEVVVATPRCVVPTLAQPELASSADTLRTVAAMNRPRILDRGRQPGVGVYATVVRRGRIAVGDDVVVRDAAGDLQRPATRGVTRPE